MRERVETGETAGEDRKAGTAGDGIKKTNKQMETYKKTVRQEGYNAKCNM